MKTSVLFALSLAGIFFAAGCGGAPSDPPIQILDGGAHIDGGVQDATVTSDGGLYDAGQPEDGGMDFDGGTCLRGIPPLCQDEDAGTPDAGTTPDGGAISDGGETTDGGIDTDGGISEDGGQYDAGITDAGTSVIVCDTHHYTCPNTMPVCRGNGGPPGVWGSATCTACRTGECAEPYTCMPSGACEGPDAGTIPADGGALPPVVPCTIQVPELERRHLLTMGGLDSVKITVGSDNVVHVGADCRYNDSLRDCRRHGYELYYMNSNNWDIVYQPGHTLPANNFDRTQAPDGGTSWLGSLTSLNIQSDNRPVVTYSPIAQPCYRYVVDPTDPTWVDWPAVCTTASGRGDVALDSNDGLHLTFQDVYHDSLWYATNTSGEWRKTFIEDSFGGSYNAGTNPHIALVDNHPFIISILQGGGFLRFSFLSTLDQWDTTTIDSGGWGWGYIYTFDYTNTNAFHVIYGYEWPNIRHQALTNRWHSDALPRGGITAAQVDATGSVHIVYEPELDIGHFYANNRGGIWKQWRVASEPLHNTALTIGSDDHVYIAYKVFHPDWVYDLALVTYQLSSSQSCAP